MVVIKNRSEHLESPNTVIFDFLNIKPKDKGFLQSVESLRLPDFIVGPNETYYYRNRSQTHSQIRNKIKTRKDRANRITPSCFMAVGNTTPRKRTSRSESRDVEFNPIALYSPACKKIRQDERPSKRNSNWIDFNQILSHFVQAMTQTIQPILNLKQVHSNLKRNELNRRISSNLIHLKQAKLYSEEAKSPDSKKKRSESYHVLGDYGRSIFSPLDVVFDYDAHEKSESDQIVPKQRSRSSTPLRVDSFISLQKLDYIRQSFRNLFIWKSVDDCDQSSVTESDIGHDQILIHPEDAEDLKAAPHILSLDHMYELSEKGFPATCQSRTWKRLFSLSRDGDCFSTFLSKVQGHKTTLLVIRTEKNVILGGFADHAWERQKGWDGRNFFGGGQSFLFSVKPQESLRTGDNKNFDAKGDQDYFEPTESLNALMEFPMIDNEIDVYKWTGANGYNQLICVNSGRIAMGGGGDSGAFGLCIEDYFSRGSSGACDTYGNPPLGRLSNDGCHNDFGENYFDIVEMDVYGFMYSWS